MDDEAAEPIYIGSFKLETILYFIALVVPAIIMRHLPERAYFKLRRYLVYILAFLVTSFVFSSIIRKIILIKNNANKLLKLPEDIEEEFQRVHLEERQLDLDMEDLNDLFFLEI